MVRTYSMILAAGLLMWSAPSHAKECVDDSLQKNIDGKILMTLSGMVFETLPGDNIEAMLWLPVSRLLICSETVAYQGQSYVIYEIINVDDGERASATRIK